MSVKKLVIALTLFTMVSCSMPILSEVSVDRSNSRISIGFEYDDNVTREFLPENHKQSLAWRLNAMFGIKDVVPLKPISSYVTYSLGMRDVNKVNQEDFNTHEIKTGLTANFIDSNRISVEESFRKWNSQNELFNFLNNVVEVKVEQDIGQNTTSALSYKNEQKRFQDLTPQVQARNYYYHQFQGSIYHSISDDFTIQLGYADQSRTYNRRPLDFKNGRPIVVKGIQKDRQKVFMLGFHTIILNNTALSLLNQIVRSKSNSRGFDFDGNKTQIVLTTNLTKNVGLDLSYQVAAYSVSAYQTPDLGYQLSETRTEDQSFIKVGTSYALSDNITIRASYEHIRNVIFFTAESYKNNIFRISTNIKF